MDLRSGAQSFNVESCLDHLAEKIATLPSDRVAALQDFLSQEWLTVEEVATVLKVHKETVRRWIKSGKLRATRASRHAPYRICREELDRFLEMPA